MRGRGSRPANIRPPTARDNGLVPRLRWHGPSCDGIRLLGSCTPSLELKHLNRFVRRVHHLVVGSGVAAPVRDPRVSLPLDDAACGVVVGPATAGPNAQRKLATSEDPAASAAQWSTGDMPIGL